MTATHMCSFLHSRHDVCFLSSSPSRVWMGFCPTSVSNHQCDAIAIRIVRECVFDPIGIVTAANTDKTFRHGQDARQKKKIENFSCFVKIIISFLFSFFFFFNGDILSNTTICFGITEHFHWQRQKVFLVIGLSYLIIPFYTHCRPYNLFPDYSQIWYDTAYGLRSKRRSHFRPSLLIFSSYIF